ncbi:hypothetical protein [Actinomadura atramentaria]|uniref:hypothetical protein n=1 Tax=Actinomadura atramentaria TaxID=1990 RepID=UPI000382524F|nr:hypothetical protein [Actinomadura atramentaria]
MSTGTKIAIGGVVVGFLTLFVFPWWLSALIIVGSIGVPVAGYLLLDPSQRKRVNRQVRKRIGS